MQGLMQQRGLLTSSILRMHRGAMAAARSSRRDDGSIARTTYAALAVRARKLARVLLGLGVKPGDRVATLAMNSDRHVELYFAISGIGAICNTINPRLAHDDIAYIAGHAGDGIIFADPGFVPIVAAIAPRLAGVLRAVVVLGEAPAPELSAGLQVHDYEALMASVDDDYAWPAWTRTRRRASVTLREPPGGRKGFSIPSLDRPARDDVEFRRHRRLARDRPGAAGRADVPRERLVPAVRRADGGRRTQLRGRHLDPASVLGLLNGERVTLGAGVPTVWLGLAAHLRETGARFASSGCIMSGGSAFPRALMAEYGNSARAPRTPGE